MSPKTLKLAPHSASSGRIPSLDGLRALSIFLVLCLHSLQRISLTHHVNLFWYGLLDGEFGVFLFFEISGFLITSLLLEEHRNFNSINLSRFYLRRAFRILPSLYLYLAIVVLLGCFGRLALNGRSLFSAIFFFHNLYAPGSMWSLEHLWSISIEEQFYLVWPFILIISLRKPSRSRLPPAAVFPLSLILLSPVLRMLLGRSHLLALHAIAIHLLRFDFIMYGCLIALLQNTLLFKAVYRRATRLWWIPPAVIILCNLLSARLQNYFNLTVGYTISGFAIAIFLLWCTRNAKSAIGYLLNHRLLVWVGSLSYSIYLWQTLWLHQGNEIIFMPISWIGRFPQNWLGILTTATVSYYGIEQPSLRLRALVIRRLQAYRGSQPPSPYPHLQHVLPERPAHHNQ